MMDTKKNPHGFMSTIKRAVQALGYRDISRKDRRKLKKQKKANRRKELFVLFAIIFSFFTVGIYFISTMGGSPQPAPQTLMSSSDREEAVESSSKVNEPKEPIPIESEYLKKVLDERKQKAIDNPIEFNRGDLEYGESIGYMSIPSVKINNLPALRGIGASGDPDNPYSGDSGRLNNTATFRWDTVVGGDNSGFASHAAPGMLFSDYDVGFSRLLTSKTNPDRSTNDLKDLLLQVGDDILFEETTTGYKFLYKVSSINDTFSFAESEKFRSQQAGSPKITLQCCLEYGNYDKRLIWVVGDLYSLSDGANTFTY